jgi:hypothetical protein
MKTAIAWINGRTDRSVNPNESCIVQRHDDHDEAAPQVYRGKPLTRRHSHGRRLSDVGLHTTTIMASAHDTRIPGTDRSADLTRPLARLIVRGLAPAVPARVGLVYSLF